MKMKRLTSNVYVHEGSFLGSHTLFAETQNEATLLACNSVYDHQKKNYQSVMIEDSAAFEVAGGWVVEVITYVVP